jgi:hypothetical protein
MEASMVWVYHACDLLIMLGLVTAGFLRPDLAAQPFCAVAIYSIIRHMVVSFVDLPYLPDSWCRGDWDSEGEWEDPDVRRRRLAQEGSGACIFGFAVVDLFAVASLTVAGSMFSFSLPWTQGGATIITLHWLMDPALRVPRAAVAERGLYMKKVLMAIVNHAMDIAVVAGFALAAFSAKWAGEEMLWGISIPFWGLLVYPMVRHIAIHAAEINKPGQMCYHDVGFGLADVGALAALSAGPWLAPHPCIWTLVMAAGLAILIITRPSFFSTST